MRNFIKHPALTGTLLIVLFGAILLTTGCYRGRPSEKTPIHIVPNMDNQPKYEPMEGSKFFADGSAMRVPPAGTIPVGGLKEDGVYFTGKTPDGQVVAHSPVTATLPLLKRGQERFNIYCSPCHGRVGDGQGIMIQRGYVPPPSFHDDRLRTVGDGHIFDVMTNGIRNMPSYRHQISVEDRWAIIAYFRALQRSQHATEQDVPVEDRGKIRP